MFCMLYVCYDVSMMNEIQINPRLMMMTSGLWYTDNTYLSGSNEQLLDFLKDFYAPPEIDENRAQQLVESLFTDLEGAKESAPALISPISQQEISIRLSRMSNSAPGKDRLEYKHIRQVDGACRVTHSMFNRCLQEHCMPSAWK